MKKLWTPALASLALAACASHSPAKQDVLPANDPAVTDLTRSADEIRDNWTVIGGIQKHEHPGYTRYLDDYGNSFPEVLSQRTDLQWSGALEPLVRKLADSCGIPLRIVGSSPTTPVLVYVDAHRERVGDVLRDVGYQAGAKAGIRVIGTPNHEVIELVYAPIN